MRKVLLEDLFDCKKAGTKLRAAEGVVQLRIAGGLRVGLRAKMGEVLLEVLYN